MVGIRGTYEYDDDDLTPGNKKEGGLHQNLFDSDGKLKGNARFTPDEDQSNDWGYEPDPQYAAQLAADERRRELQRQENFELALKAAFIAIVWARTEGRPKVEAWWQEKVAPVLEARREAREARKHRRKARRNPGTDDSRLKRSVVEPVFVEGAVVGPSEDLLREYRRNISSSEAQARYLLALLAKRLSDEQFRMLSTANIVEDEQFRELEQALGEIPSQYVAQVIEALELNYSVLADGALELATLLGLEEREGERLPIEGED